MIKNIQLENKCIRKLREKIRKFRERDKEVNEELKKANNTIADIKTKSEEDERTKEYLNNVVKCKSEECKKLEQEATTLK